MRVPSALLVMMLALAMALPCPGVTTTTFDPSTGGMFTRSTTAYWPTASGLGNAYAIDARRTVSGDMIVNEPDPVWVAKEITISSTPYYVVPLCKSNTHAFGVVAVAATWDRVVKRLLVPAGSAWEVAGSAVNTHYMLKWMDDGTTNGILLRPVTNGGSPAKLTMYWSADNGTTWAQSTLDGSAFASANDFSSGSGTTLVSTSIFWWGWAHKPGTGIVMAAEYGAYGAGSGSGIGITRSVWKSADYGKTFVTAFTTPRRTAHLHAIAYHAGQATWIVNTGDTRDWQMDFKSVDDGVTWTDLYGTAAATPYEVEKAADSLTNASGNTTLVDAEANFTGLAGYVVRFSNQGAETGGAYTILSVTNATTCVLSPANAAYWNHNAVTHESGTGLYTIWKRGPLSQVTRFYDDGNAQSILLGSDWNRGVERWNFVTNTKSSSTNDTSNPVSDQHHAWDVFKHNGVYYRCDYTSVAKAAGSPMAHLYVSRYGLEWIPYGVLTTTGTELSYGLRNFAGEWDGKLHFYGSGTDAVGRHFTISPVRLVSRTGLVVCPSTKNWLNAQDGYGGDTASIGYVTSPNLTLSNSGEVIFATESMGTRTVTTLANASGDTTMTCSAGTPAFTTAEHVSKWRVARFTATGNAYLIKTRNSNDQVVLTGNALSESPTDTVTIHPSVVKYFNAGSVSSGYTSGSSYSPALDHNSESMVASAYVRGSVEQHVAYSSTFGVTANSGSSIHGEDSASWRCIRALPVVLPATAGNYYGHFKSDIWASTHYSNILTYLGGACVFYDDPWVPFVPGGSTSGDDKWTNAIAVGPDWTHVLTAQTFNGVTDLVTRMGHQYLASYVINSGDYATVYYDPEDAKVKLEAYNDGVPVGSAVASAAQSFNRQSRITVGVRSRNGTLQLSLCTNDQVVNVGTASLTDLVGVASQAITITTGDVSGTKALPAIIWESKVIRGNLTAPVLDAVMGAGARGSWQSGQGNWIEW